MEGKSKGKDNTKVNTTLTVRATTTDADGQPHSSLEITSMNNNIRLDALVAIQQSFLDAMTGHATRTLGIAARHAEMKLGKAQKR